MIKELLRLSRKKKQSLMVLFDVIIIIIILFLSFWIRTGYFQYPTDNEKILIFIYSAPILAIPIFVGFGLYTDLVRYLSFLGLWRIIKAATTYAVSWGLLTLMADLDFVPRSVILINWFLAVLIIGGSRLFAQWMLLEVKKNNVIIYGAGSAGRQLSDALKQAMEYNPVAFIDDSVDLQNNSVRGLKVYSQGDLNDLILQHNIKEVFLAIPSISRKRRIEIINFLEQYSVVVRSLPGVTELAQGRVKVNDLLEIQLNDLLGREVVQPNENLLKKNITNKVVMISGAGGSIGSELCRQVLSLKPKKIILYEISESSLYQIDQELNSLNLFNIEIHPIIGSVIDKQRAKYFCKYYDVDTIYHAAAYKHVPLVEFNQDQGVLNNTIGTRILAEVAIESKVESFVLISSDKAVRPTNVMGASKRVAEIILQSLSVHSNITCFTMVRFGNVLDSSGSVLPLFRKQIKKGGPITVTHPKIVRYFMTIPEAVGLVIQAGAMAKGGEVFILDMGKPVRIYDLALKMINLSGLQLRNEINPEGDIEIEFTGLRPGEKLYEELLIEEKFTLTENKQIMCTEEKTIAWDELEPILSEIHRNIVSKNDENLLKLLKVLVPEFKQLSALKIK